MDTAVQPAAAAAAALERLTVRRYLLAMTAQGVWTAGYILFPFVLGKSLGAPAWLITFMVVLETSAMALALHWGRLMAHGGRRRWLVWGGLGGRAVLVLSWFATSAGTFAVLLAIVHFFAGIIYPAQNGILQANIGARRRGAVFGWGALVQYGTAGLVSLAMGRFLDGDPDRFRLVYPCLGVVGFLYPLALARLPRPAGDTSHDPTDIFARPRFVRRTVGWRAVAGGVAAPLRDAAATFRRDRGFLWFEVNFSVYGVAFLMLMTVLPLFFVRELDLNYQHISATRVLMVSAGIALLGPWAGRLSDRIHPVRLSAICYGLLALFPVLLALGAAAGPVRGLPWVYAAFAVFAVAMAGVFVTWNMGSLSFAPPDQGGFYQGIHVALVGVRGIVGPLIGFLVLKWSGYREVFVLAAAIFVVAAASSWLLARRLASLAVDDAAAGKECDPCVQTP